MSNYDVGSSLSGGDASAVGTAIASLPTKRSYKAMKNESTSIICVATLFASGMDRLKAAQLEYTLAQKNMDEIRQQIRDSGYAEPDSLLCLCDGEDNYILSYIMDYLAVEDLGRCGLVCNTLKKLAKHCSDTSSEVCIKNYMGKKEPVPKDVTFVGIHPNVAEICKDAFQHCHKLKIVVLHEGLVSIRKNAFLGCKSLTSITLPSTLIEIADSAFRECSNLEEVVLNDSLQKIGDKAFSKCISLKSIILPPALTELGYYVFSDCRSLTDIVFSEGPKSIGRLEVPSHLKDQCAMQQYDYGGERVSASNLKEVVFHEGGLRSIEKGVFSGCRSLESIKLPSTIYEIGECAFYECTKLRNVALNEGLRTIKCQAFTSCISLKSIAIPSTVHHMGYLVFVDCVYLKEVLLNMTLKNISAYGHLRSSSVHWESWNTPRIYGTINHNAFAYCPSSGSFKFPCIAARLEYVRAGHADIETKIDEIRGLVEWKDNELIVSAADMALTDKGDNWNSVKQSLNKILNLLAFYEINEAGTLFELALWKAMIDQDANWAACHVKVPEAVKVTILQYLFRGY